MFPKARFLPPHIFLVRFYWHCHLFAQVRMLLMRRQVFVQCSRAGLGNQNNYSTVQKRFGSFREWLPPQRVRGTCLLVCRKPELSNGSCFSSHLSLRGKAILGQSWVRSREVVRQADHCWSDIGSFPSITLCKHAKTQEMGPAQGSFIYSLYHDVSYVTVLGRMLQGAFLTAGTAQPF